MQKFFEQNIKENEEIITLNAENSAHIARSLRMRQDERITVCANSTDYICSLCEVGERVSCRVLERRACSGEPSIDVTLYQCLTKGDKLELIVQKAVELGVSRIVPVLSSRSISRPDKKTAAKKCERYGKISKSACEQCGRGKIVPVLPQQSLAQTIEQLDEYDISILLYEGGGMPLKTLDKSAEKIALLVGPEGGWSPDEVAAINAAGGVCVTLGPRILRTETAPLAALTALMLLSGNLE